MSGVAHPPKGSFPPSADGGPGRTRRNLAVLSSTGQTSSEPMEVTPPASTASAQPPAHSSPDSDRANTNGSSEPAAIPNNNAPNQAVGAAAAAQQPKVVQTAFIHKLYNMLEDENIQHLISWSSTNDSFVMSPTSEFSRVLSQYFKHTNISSFVRQLNMYGFHKVSDVFHTGSPDSALWEFKHGNGNFKRGDLVGLREIKRRASRHALIHRDSFTGHKTAPSQPGTPAEPVPEADARLVNMERWMYEMHNRLVRAEEGNAVLNARCQGMTESLTRCYQWTHSMTRFLQAVVPEQDSPLYRDVSTMQRELERHIDSARGGFETPQEPFLSARQPYYANVPADPGPPLSPRQAPQEGSRRPSMVDASRANMIRPPIPPHLSVSPRRYGSIGAANNSPNYNRPQPPPVMPPQQPMPHPLSSASSPGPNLGRRHTSADIRQHGWPPTGVSPFPAANQGGPPANQGGSGAAPWPSSPHRTPNPSDQQVRDVLAQYHIGGSRRLQPSSRNATPPLHESGLPTLSADSGWSIGGSRFPRHESSLPATRRSSVASNVHSLLNPADTAEQRDEDRKMTEDRKRKRLE